MKKFLAMAAAALFTMTSCSDSDEDQNKTDESSILLKRATTTYADGTSVTADYSYNDKYLTYIAYSNGKSEKYNYSAESGGELLSEIKVFENNTLITTKTLEYLQNRKLKKVITTREGHEDIYDNYTYSNNIDGTTSISISTNDIYLSNDGMAESGKLELIMNGINISEIKAMGGFNNALVVYNEVFIYDVKNAPFRNIAVNNILCLVRRKGGANNIINYHRGGSGINNNISTSYTYNENNFPTKSTQTLSNGEIVITEYYYE